MEILHSGYINVASMAIPTPPQKRDTMLSDVWMALAKDITFTTRNKNMTSFQVMFLCFYISLFIYIYVSIRLYLQPLCLYISILLCFCASMFLHFHVPLFLHFYASLPQYIQTNTRLSLEMTYLEASHDQYFPLIFFSHLIQYIVLHTLKAFPICEIVLIDFVCGTHFIEFLGFIYGIQIGPLNLTIILDETLWKNLPHRQKYFQFFEFYLFCRYLWLRCMIVQTISI